MQSYRKRARYRSVRRLNLPSKPTSFLPRDHISHTILSKLGLWISRSVAEAGVVIETTFNIQIMHFIIQPQQSQMHPISSLIDVDTAGRFDIFIDALTSLPYLLYNITPLSSVISLLYSQIESTLPQFYDKRQCHEQRNLGLQNVSVVVDRALRVLRIRITITATSIQVLKVVMSKVKERTSHEISPQLSLYKYLRNISSTYFTNTNTRQITSVSATARLNNTIASSKRTVAKLMDLQSY